MNKNWTTSSSNGNGCNYSWANELRKRWTWTWTHTHTHKLGMCKFLNADEKSKLREPSKKLKNFHFNLSFGSSLPFEKLCDFCTNYALLSFCSTLFSINFSIPFIFHDSWLDFHPTPSLLSLSHFFFSILQSLFTSRDCHILWAFFAFCNVIFKQRENIAR